MRMTRLVQVWIGLVIAVVCCGEMQSFAQEGWTPVGPPNITNLTVQTVGGITYLTHISRVESCYRVSSGPVSQYGTNLMQTINLERWSGICALDTSVRSETHVSVLGALSPGQYLLQLSSEGLFGDPFPSPSPAAFLYVSVAVPEFEAPALQVSMQTNDVKLAVAGVPNVTYTIEASTSLTNWFAVTTNVGGPFVLSQPVTSEVDQRYYRVRIEGN